MQGARASHAKDPSTIAVYAGLLHLDHREDENVQKLLPDRLVVHEQYTSQGDPPLVFDIALIHVSTDIEFNEVVQPVSLPEHDIPVGAVVMVTGWGMTDCESD